MVETCAAPECPWAGGEGGGECLLDAEREPQDYDGYVDVVVKCAKLGRVMR